MDQAAFQNFFNHIDKLWVQPEIEKRKSENQIPEGFKIGRVLILLPRDESPVVQFNDEIAWEAEVETVEPILTVGQAVHLHDIRRITGVSRPKHNGVPVAFIFLFYDAGGWGSAFDFTPNTPQSEEERPSGADEQLSRLVAKSLQQVLVERVVHYSNSAEPELTSIGLWIVPSLLPYPLIKIVKKLKDGNESGALSTIVEYCNAQWLRQQASKWWTSDYFADRRSLLEDALWAHEQGKYTLSINTLTPAVEGIITAWVEDHLPEGDVSPWRTESRAKKFRDLMLAHPPKTFTYKGIFDVVMRFVIDGPVLKTFKQWNDEVCTEFPGRHVVGHGKYDLELYTQINSIRLILLIDTLFMLISGRDDESNWLGFAPPPKNREVEVEEQPLQPAE